MSVQSIYDMTCSGEIFELNRRRDSFAWAFAQNGYRQKHKCRFRTSVEEADSLSVGSGKHVN